MTNHELPHNHNQNNHNLTVFYKLSGNKDFATVSNMFQKFSDTNRISIFWLLCHNEECVINIAAIMKMSSPAVSHHLKILSESNLITSRHDGKEVYYKASDNEISHLMHEMIENVMELTCPGDSEDYGLSSKELMSQVHDYLVEHIYEHITIDDISRHFLINPTTLKRMFKECYGTSIADHMKMHRMSHAAILLKQTNNSIQEISNAVGYKSQSRFTFSFKSIYGVTPREYRNSESEYNPYYKLDK